MYTGLKYEARYKPNFFLIKLNMQPTLFTKSMGMEAAVSVSNLKKLLLS